MTVVRPLVAAGPEAVPVLAGSLVEELAEALRDLVRRDGVDPQREAAAVRRLAEEVIRGHDDRSLTGAVEPVGDPAGVMAELVARVSGLGPLQRYLDDPTVEEFRP